MGRAKADLEWHGSTLARRVAGIVARTVGGPLMVVRSAGQALPRLPAGFEVLDDLEEDRGPLGGLSSALEALAGRAEAAYVSSTDVPFLHPAFIRRVMGGLTADFDACVPAVRGVRQPLAAAYRVSLAPLVRRLLASDRLRVSSLLEQCRWTQLDEAALLADEALARLDPRLESVTNLNEPREYQAAMVRLPPAVQVEWLGQGPLDSVSAARVTVRAATLGAAAQAFDVVLGSEICAALNGDPVRLDPEEPLAEGDLVSFARTALRR